jgi:hypothetical protein
MISMEKIEKPTQRWKDVVNSAEKEQTFEHCQWLYGEGRNREFCRNPVEPGRVWCRRHMKLVLPQKAEERLEMKLEAQETAE